MSHPLTTCDFPCQIEEGDGSLANAVQDPGAA